MTTKIGSRQAQTTFYFDNKRIQVICGCFKGTLKEFEDAIKKTHKNNKYSKQYLSEIKKVKYLRK